MGDYNKHAFNVYNIDPNVQIVKWRDKNGREQRKEYREWRDVRKAVVWLADSGALEIDVSVPAEYVAASQKSE